MNDYEKHRANLIWAEYDRWREDANVQYLDYVRWCEAANIPNEKILNFVDYWSQRNKGDN